ncbi:MAG: GNAT family N-acetyltransferase [Bacteroidota bacterium]
MIIRPYNAEKDQKAVHRIWKEVHWIDKDQEKLMDHFLEGNRALVGELGGEAESLVTSAQGTFRYLRTDLKLCAVTGVTTSRVARKQGFAGQMTAELIAADVKEGAHIAALGMFEQGYYNRLGFGTGSYDNMLFFDPASLQIEAPFRVPKRLSTEDWEIIHQAMMNRKRGHGAVNLFEACITHAELAWTEGGFGLGYFDEAEDALSHFVWMSGEKEHGPYSVKILIYQNHEQLKELLALLKSLGDQIRLINIFEPPEIQLQDLIKQPFKGRQLSKKSTYEQRHWAEAFWQIRICDLQACIEAVHIHAEDISFNLELDDPISAKLDESQPWRGISGQYQIKFGKKSSVKSGTSPKLPTLKASIGAFSRLWLGVRPASGLAFTDELEGPEELLLELDEKLRLPKAHLGWEF